MTVTEKVTNYWVAKDAHEKVHIGAYSLEDMQTRISELRLRKPTEVTVTHYWTRELKGEDTLSVISVEAKPLTLHEVGEIVMEYNEGSRSGMSYPEEYTELTAEEKAEVDRYVDEYSEHCSWCGCFTTDSETGDDGEPYCSSCAEHGYDGWDEEEEDNEE